MQFRAIFLSFTTPNSATASMKTVLDFNKITKYKYN